MLVTVNVCSIITADSKARMQKMKVTLATREIKTFCDGNDCCQDQ